MVKTLKQAEEAGERNQPTRDGRHTDFKPMKARASLVMRPGKTKKDKRTGAWAHHLTNKANQAEYNRGHKERVKKAVYERRK